MKILITAGATREPIDGVRFITNFSTGQTAAFLADQLLHSGHEVVYLHGVGARVPAGASRKLEFSDFQDLQRKVFEALDRQEFEVIIHAAAVSDYSVEYIEIGDRKLEPQVHLKIDSKGDQNISLRLRKNPKIINSIKSHARKVDPILIAFKLTNGAEEIETHEFVRRLQEYSAADFVIHNDMGDVIRDGDARQFNIYKKEVRFLKAQGLLDLSQKVGSLIGANESVRRVE